MSNLNFIISIKSCLKFQAFPGLLAICAQNSRFFSEFCFKVKVYIFYFSKSGFSRFFGNLDIIIFLTRFKKLLLHELKEIFKITLNSFQTNIQLDQVGVKHAQRDTFAWRHFCPAVFLHKESLLLEDTFTQIENFNIIF